MLSQPPCYLLMVSLGKTIQSSASPPFITWEKVLNFQKNDLKNKKEPFTGLL
jgi:hypothetical protein